jgi:hypothetical protein
MTTSGIYYAWKYRQMMRQPEEEDGREEKVKEKEEEEPAELDQVGGCTGVNCAIESPNNPFESRD